MFGNPGFALNHTPSFIDLPAFEQAANAQIVVFAAAVGIRPIYMASEERQQRVYLLHVQDP